MLFTRHFRLFITKHKAFIYNKNGLPDFQTRLLCIDLHWPWLFLSLTDTQAKVACINVIWNLHEVHANSLHKKETKSNTRGNFMRFRHNFHVNIIWLKFRTTFMPKCIFYVSLLFYANTVSWKYHAILYKKTMQCNSIILISSMISFYLTLKI